MAINPLFPQDSEGRSFLVYDPQQLFVAISPDGLHHHTHLLSVVELVGPVVVALFILLERLADDVDLLLVLRGGDGRSHNGEHDNL